ncbi:MAG: AbrB/MazE/SpoVT family DNA-binding domain-containing protein [Nanoarchaeota archaeon]
MNNAKIVTVDSKGRITIPEELRKGIKIGDSFLTIFDGELILLIPEQEVIKKFRQTLIKGKRLFRKYH